MTIDNRGTQTQQESPAFCIPCYTFDVNTAIFVRRIRLPAQFNYVVRQKLFQSINSLHCLACHQHNNHYVNCVTGRDMIAAGMNSDFAATDSRF